MTDVTGSSFGCGLLNQNENGGKHCYALKRDVSYTDRSQYWLCHYYLPVITEGNKMIK